MFVPHSTILHDPPIGSTIGGNCLLCHLFPSWEVRYSATDIGKRLEEGGWAFLNMRKVHARVLPAKLSLLSLLVVWLVSLPGSKGLEIACLPLDTTSSITSGNYITG